MSPQLKLVPRTTTSLKTTLVKYTAIASVLTAIAFISVFLVNYLGSTKEVLATVIIPTQSDLIISEYAAKGHLGNVNNEFIELYNLSNSTINLSNVSLTLFEKDKKGQKKLKGSTQLTGTLASGGYYVIATRNKSNKQPTSALPYDIQASSDLELKKKRFVELLSGTTVIDRAGCLADYGNDFNYERTDVLADGSNIGNNWTKVSNSVSSPGAENISDAPQVVAVSTTTYTSFGGNADDPAVKIKSNGSVSPGNTLVKIKRGKEHPNKPAGTTMIQRYVEITPTTQPDNVEMVYYYNDSELNGLNESALKLYSYYDSTWHYMGGVVDPVNNTITCSLINHFSDWGAAEGGGNLPIELLKFEAKYNGKSVDLSWSTATETNNDYFTIERSTDAVNYKIAGNLKGAGNSNSILNYDYNDDTSLSGTVYYRLKQTDYDGKFEYFPPVAVRITSAVENQISINSFGPNPFNNTFFVEFNTQSQEAMEVYLYNIKGQIVYKDVYQ
ncbi:lamin tail domain-containing protein, partial [Bacteroidota bacterium]